MNAIHLTQKHSKLVPMVGLQSVTTDKDSGSTNDAKLWATETMGNRKYPLELFLRVVTMGLETMKVVDGLPKLDIAAG